MEDLESFLKDERVISAIKEWWLVHNLSITSVGTFHPISNHERADDWLIDVLMGLRLKHKEPKKKGSCL